jgi:hypothetical protein
MLSHILVKVSTTKVGLPNSWRIYQGLSTVIKSI